MKNLPRLPSMPSTRATSRWVGCRCGCGSFTQSTFAPGHDARLKGIIARIVRGVMTEAEVAEWGGEQTLRAALTATDDAAMMRRWNLTEEVAAWKAEIARLEAEVKEEVAG